MTRYVAFLRGISPMNAKMPELKACFESAGFTEVKTLLSSGNIAFSARAESVVVLERRAEKAMQRELGHSFRTIVRPTSHLKYLLDADPFSAFTIAPEAKKIITFLGKPVPSPIELPFEKDGARILKLVDAELFTAYVPNEKAAAFMRVVERAFGKDITTRTLETVRKCAAA